MTGERGQEGGGTRGSGREREQGGVESVGLREGKEIGRVQGTWRGVMGRCEDRGGGREGRRSTAGEALGRREERRRREKEACGAVGVEGRREGGRRMRRSKRSE